MNLKNAKIGQKYRLFVSADGRVVDEQLTSNTIIGTVIGEGINGSIVLFGWKSGETLPRNAGPRTGNSPSSKYKYSADQKSFSYSLSLRSMAEVHSKVYGAGEYDGCQCKKCHNFYPYAEPNQEDGTLVCYSCRMFG